MWRGVEQKANDLNRKMRRSSGYNRIALATVAALAMPSSSSAFTMHHHHRSTALFSGRGPVRERPPQEEECALMPEANPNADPNADSLSGVLYADVVKGIDVMYPPRELSRRNARSRTDGYWKYVERGEEPPREFTYGEFDVDFFGMLLDRSWEHYLEGEAGDDEGGADCSTASAWRNRTFIDIGSGAGRLVLTAAALHPEWRLCRGLEILEGLHNMSTSIADRCRLDDEERQTLGVTNDNLHRILRIPHNDTEDTTTIYSSCLPLAPVDFACGSFTNPYEYLGDVDCAFVFSSCMSPDLVKDLSIAIGRQCKPGTIVITTETPLFLRGTVEPLEEDGSMPHGSYDIELLEKIDGWCWLLGGESTAYLHRVKTSLWEEYAGPRERPQLSLEEQAMRLVQLMESGELTDTQAFCRRVRNDMIFNGVSPEFLPETDEDDGR